MKLWLTPKWRNDVLWCLLVVLGIAAGPWIQTIVPYDGDIGQHINSARRIVLGQQLYCDIINVGFPIQFYMRIPGVWVAQWLDMSYMNVAIFFDNLIAITSFSLSMLALRNMRFMRIKHMFGMVAATLAFVIFVMPAINSFTGEKEYFFWVYTIPYFLVAAARVSGVDFSKKFLIFFGFFAALGFCYKPFFLLPFVIVESYMAYYHRSWRVWLRPECVSCVALWMSYMLWFWIAFPCYSTVIVPFLEFYYYMNDRDTLDILYQYCVRLIPFILVLIGLSTHPLFENNRLTPFFIVCFLAQAGYVLTCVVQMKNFFHHLYPAIAMSIFLCALMIAWIEKKREDASV